MNRSAFLIVSGSTLLLACGGTRADFDAIPHAGRYDGTVGVLGGLEAIRALKRAGFEPHRSIELVIFSAEEPTRFGIGCFGSRLMAGVLDPRSLKDRDGRSLDRRGLAGLAGVFFAVIYNLSPTLFALGLKAFPATVLGGFDAVLGSGFSGLIIGVAENLVGGYLSSTLKEVAGFLLILVVLMVRPFGLFGEREIERV